MIKLPFLKLFLLIACTSLSANSLHSQHLAVEELPDVYREGILGFVESIEERDEAKLTSFFNFKTLLDIAYNGLEVDERFKEGFSRSFLKNSSNIGKQFIANLSPEGYPHLVNVQKEKIGYSALVRIDLGDNGWGFTRFQFRKRTKSSIQVVDYYSYSSSQLMSETIRSIIALASPDKSVLKNFMSFGIGKKVDAKKLAKLEKVFNFSRDKKFAQAVEAFKGLPVEFKKDRNLAVMAVQFASQSGDNALYTEMLANLNKHNGQNPALAFILVDYHFLKGDFDTAIESFKRVMTQIKTKDAAIISMIANTYLEKGEFKQAEFYYQKAISLEPKLELPYWSAVTLYIQTEDFDKAAAMLQKIEGNLGYQFSAENFLSNEFYNKFVESDAYKNWLKNQ